MHTGNSIDANAYIRPKRMLFCLCAAICGVIVLSSASCSRYWYAIHSRAVKVAPEKIPFSAGPYIQIDCAAKDRKSRARGYVIRWFDPAARHGVALYYGFSSDLSQMMRVCETPGGDGRLHEFRLASLEQGRRYYYAVPYLDDTVRSFQTEARPGVKVRMMCLGDTENTASDRDTMSYFCQVASQALSFYEEQKDPVLFLHLGDMVKFGSDYKAWNAFFEDSRILSQRVPSMYAIGNHEMKGDFGAHYDYFFSHSRYYSFDWGNAHVLVLHPFDGIIVSEDGPRVSSSCEQYSFAAADLKRNRDRKWLIVALHFPLYSTGDFNMNRTLIGQYRTLFRKNRVDVVLGGHDHSFDSFHDNRGEPWGGTWYVVCGTGGSRLDSYIMDRKKNRWNGWFHDRTSEQGLYQDDNFTRRNHVYGELSWGFTDLEIGADELAINYYRWLSLPEFLEATGQSAEKWDIVPLSSSFSEKYGSRKVTAVKRFVKRRSFR